MKSRPLFLGVHLMFVGMAAIAAGDDGFTPLFNGEDLTGWVNVQCDDSTWNVRDEMIVCSGVPIGVLRTEKHYENFILELEWKHLKPGGNAGLFIYSDPITARGQPFTRSTEVQILDGNHGDIFSIHGATMVPDRPHPQGWMRCLPSEKRANPAGQWNHYRVESREGKVTLAVNGKVVSGASECNPRKGYICLESEGSEVHFRNIRIKELPSSNPPPELVADFDRGFQSLYNGVDFEGWRLDPGDEGHWTAKDWIIDYDGKSAADDPNLWTAEEFGDFEMIVDWRLPGEPREMEQPLLGPDGKRLMDENGEPVTKRVQDAGDSGIFLRGSSKAQVNIWCWPAGSGEVYGYREDLSLPEELRAKLVPMRNADAPLGRWNRFVIRLQGEDLTVDLNGARVIDRATLPGIPSSGPIGLQHHGDPVQFANIYIRRLNEP